MLVAQLCLTLCNPMDCSPPGSSVHEIFQARILEWVAIYFSRGSSQPRDRTWVSCTAGRFFTDWAIREAGNGKRTFFTWGCAVSFWSTGHEHRMVHKGCISHSEINLFAANSRKINLKIHIYLYLITVYWCSHLTSSGDLILYTISLPCL